MEEGFPCSLASMSWEGREPLRDWICLCVSLCFCALDSCILPFLIFPEIRNSDWAEIWTWFLSGYWLSCGERRAWAALRSGHEGPGRAWPPGARPCLVPPSGIVSRWFFFPKFINIPKKSPSVFIPFGLRLIWIFCEIKNMQQTGTGTGH